ncbi:MAG: hypothetical protein ACLQVF_32715 [Isosphaeraceae bacterium]
MSIDRSGDSSRDTHEVESSSSVPDQKLALEGKPPSQARMAVQEMLEMFAHSGPMPDPFLDKLDGQQITKTLEISEQRVKNDFELRKAAQANQLETYKYSLYFLGFLSVCVLGMVWAFLHYGKTEQVFNLIAILFAGGGGVGIGTGLANRRSRPDPPVSTGSGTDAG